MEIRDPVHGFIFLPHEELKIVNTSIFRRLRGIKQLAMAYLVYPGATHTRFEHSLGVFHIAHRMAKLLLPKEDDEHDRRIVRLAALLHDIGHGPFSHVSDLVFDRFGDSALSEAERPGHEAVTLRILETDSELVHVLGRDTVNDVVSLLRGEDKSHSIMREMISSGIDADKMDYLLRDSLFCGVKYGVFDLDRILNCLTRHEEQHDIHIAVEEGGVDSVEQFVFAKYFMTRQVYAHRVRIICDEMIARAVELGLDEEVDFLCQLYRYRNTEDYLHNYSQWNDSKMIDSILNNQKKGRCEEIFRRLYERRLFKMVFSVRFRELEGIPSPFRDRLSEISSPDERDLRRELEHQISRLQQLQCAPEHVILNCPITESPKEMFLRSEGELQVIRKMKPSMSFGDASPVFASISESFRDQRLDVYAPLEYEGRRGKDDILSSLDKEILKLLQDKGRKHEN